MLTYYLDLALRSFRSARGLTVLMVLAIAMGIGASMTTLTTFRALSGDPIPARSGQLFRVELDAAPRSRPEPNGEPEDQLTRLDAETLLRDKRGVRQAIMVGGDLNVEPPRDAAGSTKPFGSSARYATADFFPMFATPFLYGSGWTAADDDAKVRVAVIGKALNQRVFGGANSVGRTLRLEQSDYRIVGVLDDWQPVPYFFDLNVGRYRKTEGVFVPLSAAIVDHLGANGSVSCWGNNAVSDFRAANVPCTWLQYWVELDTPAARAAYADYLTRYSDQQHAAGRFERPANVRLYSVMQWLSVKHVVPADVRLQLWLAFGFLAVCLVNTVGLLLAKCLRRSPEIGVRRALGASRRAIFQQFLVEACTIGLAGGALGLVLAAAGVWIVRQGAEQRAQWVHLDAEALGLTLALSLAASLVAGLLPAWRACQVSPASQLKSS